MGYKWKLRPQESTKKGVISMLCGMAAGVFQFAASISLACVGCGKFCIANFVFSGLVAIWFPLLRRTKLGLVLCILIFVGTNICMWILVHKLDFCANKELFDISYWEPHEPYGYGLAPGYSGKCFCYFQWPEYKDCKKNSKHQLDYTVAASAIPFVCIAVVLGIECCAEREDSDDGDHLPTVTHSNPSQTNAPTRVPMNQASNDGSSTTNNHSQTNAPTSVPMNEMSAPNNHPEPTAPSIDDLRAGEVLSSGEESPWSSGSEVSEILQAELGAQASGSQHGSFCSDLLDELVRRVEQLEEERNNARDQQGNVSSCVICFERRPEVMFLPCKHFHCCKSCADRLQDPRCPTCRQEIRSRIVPYQ